MRYRRVSRLTEVGWVVLSYEPPFATYLAVLGMALVASPFVLLAALAFGRRDE